jgi:hypothetical protein
LECWNQALAAKMLKYRPLTLLLRRRWLCRDQPQRPGPTHHQQQPPQMAKSRAKSRTGGAGWRRYTPEIMHGHGRAMVMPNRDRRIAGVIAEQRDAAEMT